jgi:hypothetical protein
VLSNFALVHGLWDDTWCWARAILKLWRSGQDCAVAGLSRDRGAGTQKHEMAFDQAATSPSHTTVMAHSAPDLVAPFVARRHASGELVLVAAVMHLPVCSRLTQRKTPKSTQHLELLLRHEPNMVVDAEGYGTCRLIDAAEAFYAGCDPTDAAVTAQGLSPQDMIIFIELTALVPAAAPTRHVASSQERAKFCDCDIALANSLTRQSRSSTPRDRAAAVDNCQHTAMGTSSGGR